MYKGDMPTASPAAALRMPQHASSHVYPNVQSIKLFVSCIDS